jgi:hypothetical protein
MLSTLYPIYVRHRLTIRRSSSLIVWLLGHQSLYSLDITRIRLISMTSFCEMYFAPCFLIWIINRFDAVYSKARLLLLSEKIAIRLKEIFL